MFSLVFKKILLVSLFLTLLIPAFSESQVEIGLNVPMTIGVTVDGENVSENVPYFIPFPDLMYNYYFNLGALRLGIGVRAWTLIVASAAYPIVSAELYMEPFLFNFNVGGGYFVYTALDQSGTADGNVFFPEASASVRVNDWFSIGAGVLGIYVPEVTDSGMGYAITIISRFRVAGPGK